MSRDRISIRETERQQLLELLPETVEVYEELGLDEPAETIRSLQTEFSQDQETYDLGKENWDEIALALEELDSTRASWLASKIARRAGLTVVQMGFSTSVPIGVTMADQEPTYPS